VHGKQLALNRLRKDPFGDGGLDHSRKYRDDVETHVEA